MSKPAKPHWNERMGAAANARHELPRLVKEYFAHVRLLLAADPPPPELHVIRLASKRLRYTLELFRDCYGPGFNTRLESLQQLQQLLGEVNDCAAAERLIGELIPKSAARQRYQEYLHRRAGAKAVAVRKEWHESFDAPGRERWWTAYLAKNARR